MLDPSNCAIPEKIEKKVFYSSATSLGKKITAIADLFEKIKLKQKTKYVKDKCAKEDGLLTNANLAGSPSRISTSAFEAR